MLGVYNCDIITMEPDQIKDGHIVRKRHRTAHKKYSMVGEWLLWDETAAAMEYGVKEWQLERAFRELRDKFRNEDGSEGLPEQKGLRKTVAQWIEDAKEEQAARNYRCEKTQGCHGKYYVLMSETQVATLDSMLTMVHRMVFGK